MFLLSTGEVLSLDEKRKLRSTQRYDTLAFFQFYSQVERVKNDNEAS